MLVADFDYHLPEDLIAQEPLADRAGSRMLHLERATGQCRDRMFRDFPELLRPDDLVVFNNTRVFPARLYGHRSGARAQPVSGRNRAAKEFLRGKVEVLLTGPVRDLGGWNGAEAGHIPRRLKSARDDNYTGERYGTAEAVPLRKQETSGAEAAPLRKQETSGAEAVPLRRQETSGAEAVPLRRNEQADRGGEPEIENPGTKAPTDFSDFAARLKSCPDTRPVSGGKTERHILTDSTPLVWNALVHPGRKIGVGERLFLGENGELQAEVIGRGEFGERTLRFDPVPDFFGTVERIGHVPLPPYIGREDRPEDRERYQTVYARERGSVAAPTAGLHFTPEILGRMRALGIETAEVTLHVGLGTFQPVHAERVEDHKLHCEWYSISAQAAGQISRARQAGRRIVAIGTTTVRTLEYAASQAPAGDIRPGTGEADIFIYPGYEFRVVGAMLTNFHLPKSTLLMLVCAFAGRERVLAAYRYAVEQRYRFYSYGDCMFVE